MANDGWMYQGRQEHQWFGHGTKPKASDDPVPATLEGRIQSLGLTAIAGLPASKRGHRAATFDPGALADLTVAMTAWVRARNLSVSTFAER